MVEQSRSGQLYLSRARLRTGRGEALASIAPMLVGGSKSRTAAAGHRIVWMLFQKTPDAGHEPNWRQSEDGFLWREEAAGRYMILSRREPADEHALFELQSKSFEPALRAGDRLGFALRANPVVSTKAALANRDGGSKPDQARQRGKRVDVVMHALNQVQPTRWQDGHAVSGRALERDTIATAAVTDWLTKQGARHGFAVAKPPTVSNYAQVAVERTRGRPAGISVADISGEIEVTDPATFVTRLPLGFGSAKAFGCGLMLIRRAS